MANAPANVVESQENAAVKRSEWIARVEALVEQIGQWAKAENWHAEKREKSITEKFFGTYTVHELAIHRVDGEIVINPIGLIVGRRVGRIDIEAFPTLSRVKLLEANGNGWTIMTDSNVPLRVEWNRQNFRQLVDDLLA